MTDPAKLLCVGCGLAPAEWARDEDELEKILSVLREVLDRADDGTGRPFSIICPFCSVEALATNVPQTGKHRLH